MKIKYFKYENKNLELKINPIIFSNLSLLVGVSSVGKTLILQSISDLIKMSQGKFLDGVEWEIKFVIGKDEKIYLWRGAFERTGLSKLENDFYGDDNGAETMAPRPKILYEKLYLENEIIVERKENDIRFKGQSTPKLSSYKSVLNLFYDNRNLQYILTSHHPYVINAIGMEYWKVVSRNGGVISTENAKEYKLGKSRHEAFKQLIQLNDYRKGIKA